MNQAVVPDAEPGSPKGSDADDVDDRDRVDKPQVECPICGEYRGRVASVEAHITGKSDDAHRGKVGYAMREELLRRQRDADPDVEPDDVDEAECPNCGEGLGMTREEAHAFVAANNGGWCDGCGARLTVDPGDA